MTAEAQHDFSSLRWIRSGIDDTLRLARRALEDFAEGDSADMQACLDNLHRVRGSLEIAQVYGGAMLADEMEQLARALSQGKVSRADSASEALMLGLVQLPAYLEKLESGEPDIPLILLPLMNDLRAARDAALVSEISLFAPKLDSVIAASPVRPGSGNPALGELARRQRPQFHRGLLRWYRGHDAHKGLQAIRDVVEALTGAARTGRMRQLLDATEALVVALQEETIDASIAVKLLFGRFDRVIKDIIDHGEEAAVRDFPLDLLKNALYYIARSTSENPIVQAVRRSADLANSFPDLSGDGSRAFSLGGPDRKLFGAVSDALKGDLVAVKDQLDLYIRGDRHQLDRLTGLAAPLQRVGDTLGMIGRGDLRTRLKHNCEQLERIGESGAAPDDDGLMKLAGNILFVESALAGLKPPVAGQPQELREGDDVVGSLSQGELDEHIAAAVREAFIELAQAKEKITSYVADASEPGILEDVPGRLHAVAGAFNILGQPEAAKLLDELAPYIAELAAGRRAVPDREEGDALADVVISVEYFIEAVMDKRSGRAEILDYAYAAFGRLGLASAFADDEETGDETQADAEQRVASAEKPAFDDIDSEILDVFLEEAGEELANIQTQYPRWRSDQDDEEALSTMRRSFHTLKGSGRLVGAKVVGEFAWALENLLNRVIDGTVRPGGEVFSLLDEAIGMLPALIAPGPGQAVPPEADITQLENRAVALSSLQPVDEESSSLEADSGFDSSGLVEYSAQQEEDVAEPGSAQGGEPAEPEPVPADETSEPEPDNGRAEGAVALELDDADDLTIDFELDAAVDESGEGTADEHGLDLELESEDLVLDALPGAEDDSEVTSSELASDSTLDDKDLGDAIEGGMDSDALPSETPSGMAAVTDAAAPDDDALPDDASLLAEVASLREGTVEEVDLDLAFAESVLQAVDDDQDESVLVAGVHAPIVLDPVLHDIFDKEARSHLAGVAEFIDACRGLPQGCVFGDDLRRSMHTLRGSARVAEVEPIAGLSGALEAWLNQAHADGQRSDQASLDLLERSHYVIGAILDVINIAGASLPDWQALVGEIDQRMQATTEATGPTTDSQLAVQADIDPELAEIFIEEARELLDSLESDFDAWRRNADASATVSRMQRALHTIKGGARLSGLKSLGNLSHAMESLFESIAEHRVSTDGKLQDLSRHALDILAADVDAIERSHPLRDHGAAIERLESAARGGEWSTPEAQEIGIDALSGVPADAVSKPTVESASELPSELTGTSAAAADGPSAEAEAGPPGDSDAIDLDGPDSIEDDDGSTLLIDSRLMSDSEILGKHLISPEAPPAEGDDANVGTILRSDSRIIQFPGTTPQDRGQEEFIVRRPPPEEGDEAGQATPHERVRVRSELLDQLVNNAGEVSIYRARLEQQNSTLGFNLQELAQTVERLQAQLRGLESETEAQILSRYEREHEGAPLESFDPLEMDRYSTLQQLSRALSETVNDLGSIGESLENLNRDSDTLLLQQERVMTDLQDGLLRTRMVPFASGVTRLQRVVRQACSSLGKQASLDVTGADAEMDRVILERMMAPLEHLLRNAIVHGVESPGDREQSGKSAEGRISLVMAREGAEVVLTVADDGAGLNRERIRAKALERGLLDPHADIDDDELDQFIMEAGFSTAEEVTQIAGRGVGLDVVVSEVKQLGGTLEVDSQPGRGSEFTIRLPFTLAITQALLVGNGDEIYAVPHGSMDGVVRISREELEQCYRGEKEFFDYGGREYQVRYLGLMLGQGRPLLPEGRKWFPVLLVRSGERRVAVHVDELLGNRQIVVKSVGAQLTSVRWFTGGTILADGRIALILDMNSLVRMDSAQHAVAGVEEEGTAPLGVKVMVVDDSITVRKVTARLLERHNMEVITAKDGVDAVTILQEEHPDVMLLDIEMPRMDGFELARHMRSTDSLKDIPVIMITSRTGEKHRSHAFELGVKRYLGKPYQESDLLENIYTVLAGDVE